MVYTPQTWADNDVTKPLSADRMNHIESGLVAASDVNALAADPAFTGR